MTQETVARRANSAVPGTRSAAPEYPVRFVGALLAVAVAAVHVADQGGITTLGSPAWMGWGFRLIEVGGVLTALLLLLPGSVGPRRARLGTVRLGTVRLGTVRLVPSWFGPPSLGWAARGAARRGAVHRLHRPSERCLLRHCSPGAALAAEGPAARERGDDAREGGMA